MGPSVKHVLGFFLIPSLTSNWYPRSNVISSFSARGLVEITTRQGTPVTSNSFTIALGMQECLAILQGDNQWDAFTSHSNWSHLNEEPGIWRGAVSILRSGPNFQILLYNPAALYSFNLLATSSLVNTSPVSSPSRALSSIEEVLSRRLPSSFTSGAVSFFLSIWTAMLEQAGTQSHSLLALRLTQFSWHFSSSSRKGSEQPQLLFNFLSTMASRGLYYFQKLSFFINTDIWG